MKPRRRQNIQLFASSLIPLFLDSLSIYDTYIFIDTCINLKGHTILFICVQDGSCYILYVFPGNFPAWFRWNFALPLPSVTSIEASQVDSCSLRFREKCIGHEHQWYILSLYQFMFSFLLLFLELGIIKICCFEWLLGLLDVFLDMFAYILIGLLCVW